MKKKIITIVLASMLSVSMAACGESENTDTAQSEPEYVDNINAVASDPDAYAGKYIKFSLRKYGICYMMETVRRQAGCLAARDTGGNPEAGFPSAGSKGGKKNVI